MSFGQIGEDSRGLDAAIGLNVAKHDQLCFAAQLFIDRRGVCPEFRQDVRLAGFRNRGHHWGGRGWHRVHRAALAGFEQEHGKRRHDRRRSSFHFADRHLVTVGKV